MNLDHLLLCPLLKIYNSEIVICIPAEKIHLLQISQYMKKGINLVVSDSV